MSSIMRARSGLTGGWEGSEVIGVPFSSRRLMDLRCSGSDAPTVTRYRASPSSKLRRPRRVLPPARAGSFTDLFRTFAPADPEWSLCGMCRNPRRRIRSKMLILRCPDKTLMIDPVAFAGGRLEAVAIPDRDLAGMVAD